MAIYVSQNTYNAGTPEQKAQWTVDSGITGGIAPQQTLSYEDKQRILLQQGLAYGNPEAPQYQPLFAKISTPPTEYLFTYRGETATPYTPSPYKPQISQLPQQSSSVQPPIAYERIGGFSSILGNEVNFLSPKAKEPIMSYYGVIGGVSEYSKPRTFITSPVSLNIPFTEGEMGVVGSERQLIAPNLFEKTRQEFMQANAPGVIGGVSLVGGGAINLMEVPKIDKYNIPIEEYGGKSINQMKTDALTAGFLLPTYETTNTSGTFIKFGNMVRDYNLVPQTKSESTEAQGNWAYNFFAPRVSTVIEAVPRSFLTGLNPLMFPPDFNIFSKLYEGQPASNELAQTGADLVVQFPISVYKSYQAQGNAGDTYEAAVLRASQKPDSNTGLYLPGFGTIEKKVYAPTAEKAFNELKTAQNKAIAGETLVTALSIGAFEVAGKGVPILLKNVGEYGYKGGIWRSATGSIMENNAGLTFGEGLFVKGLGKGIGQNQFTASSTGYLQPKIKIVPKPSLGAEGIVSPTSQRITMTTRNVGDNIEVIIGKTDAVGKSTVKSRFSLTDANNAARVDATQLTLTKVSIPKEYAQLTNVKPRKVNILPDKLDFDAKPTFGTGLFATTSPGKLTFNANYARLTRSLKPETQFVYPRTITTPFEIEISTWGRGKSIEHGNFYETQTATSAKLLPFEKSINVGRGGAEPIGKSKVLSVKEYYLEGTKDIFGNEIYPTTRIGARTNYDTYYTGLAKEIKIGGGAAIKQEGLSFEKLYRYKNKGVTLVKTEYLPGVEYQSLTHKGYELPTYKRLSTGTFEFLPGGGKVQLTNPTAEFSGNIVIGGKTSAKTFMQSNPKILDLLKESGQKTTASGTSTNTIKQGEIEYASSRNAIFGDKKVIVDVSGENFLYPSRTPLGQGTTGGFRVSGKLGKAPMDSLVLAERPPTPKIEPKNVGNIPTISFQELSFTPGKGIESLGAPGTVITNPQSIYRIGGGMPVKMPKIIHVNKVIYDTSMGVQVQRQIFKEPPASMANIYSTMTPISILKASPGQIQSQPFKMAFLPITASGTATNAIQIGTQKTFQPSMATTYQPQSQIYKTYQPTPQIEKTYQPQSENVYQTFINPLPVFQPTYPIEKTMQATSEIFQPPTNIEDIFIPPQPPYIPPKDVPPYVPPPPPPIIPLIFPPFSLGYSENTGELFGATKSQRKRYVPDITSAFFGITRRGKAPLYNTLGIQPIYIDGKPNQLVRHATPRQKPFRMPAFKMPKMNKQPQSTFKMPKVKQKAFRFPNLNINFNNLKTKRSKNKGGLNF